MQSKVLIVGHRGMGANGALGEGRLQLRENTLASLQAAGALGANLVEFDVQVTADGIPVLWHDWTIPGGQTVPAVEFQLMKQLCNVHDPRVLDGPLATLAQVMEQVEVSLGFNVEIKYPLPGEIEPSFPDIHGYLQSICSVLKNLTDRKVVISSFHPEVCRWIKQNTEFKVLFLTCAGTWQTEDPRCNSLEAAIEFAVSEGLGGIATLADPLTLDPKLIEQMHARGLQVWSWGAINNDPASVAKQIGIDAIICDDLATILKTC